MNHLKIEERRLVNACTNLPGVWHWQFPFEEFLCGLRPLRSPLPYQVS